MERLFPAATISLLNWALLGFLGVCVAEQPRPANHVASLLEQGRLSLQSPLRWHGRLRDEPAKLPWGYGLEIDLSEVEFEGASLPVQGGLLERTGDSKQTFATRLARLRKRLRDEIETLCGSSPQTACVLRATLLGDRTFVDRAECADFQKTGAFHVLVVAGLHVGAIAAVLFWAGRKLRLKRSLTILFTLALLFLISPNCKTTRLARFQFSTHICGHWLHCGSGCAVAGKDGATLYASAARLERCHAGRSA